MRIKVHSTISMFALLALATVTVVGCKAVQPSTNQNDLTNQQANTNTNQNADALLNITLSSQNNSGMGGTVTLSDANGLAVVTIAATGALTDTPQPAHIHTGTCAELGDVIYPLTNVVNGASVTELPISLGQLLDQRPWGVNVHKSVDEANIYVACGEPAGR